MRILIVMQFYRVRPVGSLIWSEKSVRGEDLPALRSQN